MAENRAPDVCFQGEDERDILVGASGHVRAGTCFPLRDSVLARLAGPGPVPEVAVDLSACTYMDSTFIGLLVAIDVHEALIAASGAARDRFGLLKQLLEQRIGRQAGDRRD